MNNVIDRCFVTAPRFLPTEEVDAEGNPIYRDVVADFPIAVKGFEKFDETGVQVGYMTLADYLLTGTVRKVKYLPSGEFETPHRDDSHFMFGFSFTMRGGGEFIAFLESQGLTVFDDAELGFDRLDVIYALRHKEQLAMQKSTSQLYAVNPNEAP